MKEIKVNYDFENQMTIFEDWLMRDIKYKGKHYLIPPTDSNPDSTVILPSEICDCFEDFVGSLDAVSDSPITCDIPDIAMKIFNYDKREKTAHVKLLPKRESLYERLAIIGFFYDNLKCLEEVGHHEWERDLDRFVKWALGAYIAVRKNADSSITITNVNKRNREETVHRDVELLDFVELGLFNFPIFKKLGDDTYLLLHDAIKEDTVIRGKLVAGNIFNGRAVVRRGLGNFINS